MKFFKIGLKEKILRVFREKRFSFYKGLIKRIILGFLIVIIGSRNSDEFIFRII